MQRLPPDRLPPDLGLSLPQARRIALAAQGFADPRPSGPVTMRHIQRIIDRVGAVQIDSVNVLVRSQYLPFFSRLGAYDVAVLDRARDRAPRRLVEAWAHEASLVAPDTWPLLAFRRRRVLTEAWGSMQRAVRDHLDLVEAVHNEVLTRGPLTSRQLEAALAHDAPRVRQGWGWNWSVVKAALEYLFWAGRIGSAGRTTQFERRYAGLAQVLPPTVHDRCLQVSDWPTDKECYRDLVLLAAQAHGVGTEQDLRDYFRLTPQQARPAIVDLVGTGDLLPVSVQGWKRAAYLHRDARMPRQVRAQALLSPFDSLIWQRERTRLLFGFDYRLELYVPAARRVHGYYVLPFLFDQTLVGRVDLKSDRTAGVLRVVGVHWEPGAPAAAGPALAEELARMAGWLGLPGGISPAGLRRPA